MGFKDLSEFLTPDLRLPVNGKTYGISPTAKQVLAIRDIYTRTVQPGIEVSDDEFTTAMVDMLGADYDTDKVRVTGRDGSVWSQMEADGVSGEQLMRVANTVALWFGMGHEAAERFWESGSIFPKALGPNRKARRASKPKKKGSGSRPRTDGTTPDPAPTE